MLIAFSSWCSTLYCPVLRQQRYAYCLLRCSLNDSLLLLLDYYIGPYVLHRSLFINTYILCCNWRKCNIETAVVRIDDAFSELIVSVVIRPVFRGNLADFTVIRYFSSDMRIHPPRTCCVVLHYIIICDCDKLLCDFICKVIWSRWTLICRLSTNAIVVSVNLQTRVLWWLVLSIIWVT